MVQALPGTADVLIAEQEQEFAGFAAQSPQPEAMTATREAEAHLLRGVRSIVIAEMLRRVGFLSRDDFDGGVRVFQQN